MVSVNVIILCGGKGTRVKSLLGEMPKVLTPRGGRPHLAHLLSQVIRCYPDARVYLATGIGSKFVEAFVTHEEFDVTISYETEPLGTGGAVLKCMVDNNLESALVINGDTIYSDLPPAHFVIALKKNTVFLSYRENRDRFGSVEFDSDGGARFLSNGTRTPGLVNSGLYYVTDNIVNKYNLNVDLSLESEIIDVKEFDFSVLNINFQDFGVREDLVRYTDIDD